MHLTAVGSTTLKSTSSLEADDCKTHVGEDPDEVHTINSVFANSAGG